MHSTKYVVGLENEIIRLTEQLELAENVLKTIKHRIAPGAIGEIELIPPDVLMYLEWIETKKRKAHDNG